MGQMQKDPSRANPPTAQGSQGQGRRPTEGHEERGHRQGMQATRPHGTAAPWSPQGYGSPFSTMQRFMEQMDQMFGEFMGAGPTAGAHGGLARGAAGQGMWSPQIEVFRDGQQLVVRADLPGMSTEDVRIEIQDNVLTIAGERRHEHEERREGWFHSERSYGTFQRSVQLPRGVKTEDADATFDNGVLEVRFAAAPSGGRNVEIRAGSSRSRRQGDGDS